MRSPRSLLFVLLAALALLVAAPVASASHETPAKGKKAKAQLKRVPPVKGVLKAKIGIADQKADVFTDPRFLALKLTLARRSVAWDAMDYDWQVADLDAWMFAARAAGVRPLITWARSRIGSRRHMKPTAAQIRTGFLKFRARYPWVTDFVASNESNHYGEPTGRSPKLAAQHYKAMRSACRTCKIAAATLFEQPNMVRWAKQFIRHAKVQPKYWALHNYVSANRFQVDRTRELLAAIKGELWLTEVGGLVKRRTRNAPGKVKLREGTSHAAQVTRYIFDHLARVSPRITRVYVYHWNAEGPRSTWDSGLIASDGRPRAAFTVFVNALKAIRAGKVPKSKPPKGGKRAPKGKKKVTVGGEIPA